MNISSDLISDSYILPTSKSYGARALIIGALKKTKVTVLDIPGALDNQELLSVFEKLELVEGWDNKVILNKSFPKDELLGEELELDLGEGGTTIRFLLTFLSLGSRKYKIKVNKRFKSRPYKDQLRLLERLGANIKILDGDFLCSLKGPINLSTIELDCSDTTQVASSFALLKSVYEFELITHNLKASKKYFDMTVSMVKEMKDEYIVPVDMSSAGYFIALSALSKKVHFRNINSIDPNQADSYLLDVLKSIGCHFEFSPSLVVNPNNNLKPFFVDGSRCIDLVPTLCFLASFIEGESRIRNVQNLVFKESNRLKGITNILDSVGVDYSVEDNEISIRGKKSYRPIDDIATSFDHRMVMVGSLFLKMLGGGKINNPESVNKSFPDFFNFLNAHQHEGSFL